MVAVLTKRDEDRLGDLQLSRQVASRVNLHFLLLQDDFLRHHVGLAMAPLATKDDNTCVKNERDGLRDLFRMRLRKAAHALLLRLAFIQTSLACPSRSS